MDTNKAVEIHPLDTLQNYTYTVIFCRFENKWLYCRAKERDVFETAGGRVEPGENVLEAAKRELFEETGAIDFTIAPAFDYSVSSPGQVFVADIKKLGEMPPFEMAELKTFDTIPDKMRFPEILPVLFKNVQGWLNRQKAKQELWDVYDANKNLTGRTHRRGDPLPEGDYHLVAISLLQNSKDEFLIARRSPLITSPNIWAFPGGAVSAGEDSLTAVVREIKEETGLSVLPQNGKLLHTEKPHGIYRAFFDIWLFRQDFNIKDVILQDGENTDAKYASIEKIRQMVASGEFHNSSTLEVASNLRSK